MIKACVAWVFLEMWCEYIIPNRGFLGNHINATPWRAAQPNQAGGWGKVQEALGRAGSGEGSGNGREGGVGVGWDEGSGRGRWREGGRCGEGFGEAVGGLGAGGLGRFCAHRRGARFPCVHGA